MSGIANPVVVDLRKLPRIGVLMSGSEASSRLFLDGLRKGLVDVGIAEGTGVVLDIKYAEGRMDRLDALAIELVLSAPQLLFAGGDQGSSAVKRAAAGRLPIVAVTCDALAAGLVTSLRHPGENLTGITCINADLAAKRVELMREFVPSLSRLGIALDPGDKRMVSELRESERAGLLKTIGITALEVTKPDDIESALTLAVEKQLGGVIFVFDSMTFFHRSRLAKAAIHAGCRPPSTSVNMWTRADCSRSAQTWRTCIASRHGIFLKSSRAKPPARYQWNSPRISSW
jgi:putative ABC transport system substrate-binding protein